MANIPLPIDLSKWKPGYDLYMSLSVQQDFKDCVDDILARTGVPDEIITQMSSDNSNYQELAKCFVPEILDPIHNYELYEMIGDQTLNKAAFNYIFRIVHPRISGVDKKITVGYMDSMKQYYISTKFYSSMAQDIGFSEFFHQVCYQRPDLMPSIVGRNSKTLDQLYEDLIEAFVGCLELLVDRYVGMHRGYAYVANFVYDLLSDIHINFDAAQYWSNHKLLKEANDRIDKYNKDRPDARLRNHLVTIENKKMIGVSGFVFKQGKNIQIQDSRQIPGIIRTIENDKVTDEIVCGLIIDYMKRLPEYASFIKGAPTPEQLGIEDLVPK
jgi:dsRNA-specific ribonuclease